MEAAAGVFGRVWMWSGSATRGTHRRRDLTPLVGEARNARSERAW